MNKKVIEFNLAQRKKKARDFRAGDIVRVHRKIIEGGKERIQIFEGMVIAVKGKQSSSPTITVRKVAEGVGVELIVPIFSPKVDKIEVVKSAGIRKSKAYYIRERSAKSLRMKYKDVAEFAKGEVETEQKGQAEEASEKKIDEKEPQETSNVVKKAEDKKD
jgi:large subunit ribosomal protein L19